MLHYQRSTSLKTQEAENMGKKTVLIAGRNILKRKVSSATEGGIVAYFVVGSFRAAPLKAG
jgi:choline kinase